MKLRQHRGHLDDSMKTVVEIEPYLDALYAEVRRAFKPWPMYDNIKKSDIRVEHYCYDDRIQWDTWIVMITNIGVYGFTDGPLLQKPNFFMNLGLVKSMLGKK